MINKSINIRDVASFLLGKSDHVRPYTLLDCRVSKRDMVYWQERGVLIKDNTPNKTRRFNFKELVWIRLVSKLRKLTVSFEAIADIKEELFQQTKLSDYLMHPDADKYVEAAIQNLDEDQYVKQEIRNNYKTSEHVNKISITNFDIMLSKILHEKGNVTLLLAIQDSVNGEIQRRDGDQWMTIFIPDIIEELTKIDGYNQIFLHDYIAISLNDLLKDVIVSIDPGKIPDRFFQLTNEEKQILQFIRGGKYKSIAIRFNDDKKPYLAELTEIKKLKNEARIFELIYKGAYQNIEIGTQEGMIYSCTSTRKIKL
ncbi:MAG: MerR family transcriptional regulator [Bacteroidetes bacterium]|nr:MerR family transcriptional regulator [Bacteroidota bacterium]